MIQCSECMHWARTWIGGMATVVEGEWNNCSLMDATDGEKGHPNTLAYGIYLSDTVDARVPYGDGTCEGGTSVKTAPTFSCSMFKSNAHFAKLRIDVQEGA